MKKLIIIAFLIRLILPVIAYLYAHDYNVFYLMGDSYLYVDLAKELTNHGQFYFRGQPNVHRTPGYPAFLVPGILLGSVEWTAITLQAVISCITIYLVYKITILLFKKKEPAFFAAVLYAFEPLSILYSCKLLSETPFALLLMLFLFLIIKYLQEGSAGYLWASAVTLAGSVYMRVITYYSPHMLIVILLIWILLYSNNKKKQIMHLCVFIIIVAVLIGLWEVRNGIRMNYWQFSSLYDINIFYFKGAAVIAEKEHISLDQGQNKIVKIYLKDTGMRSYPLPVQYEYMRKTGIKIILSNPWIYLKTYMKGLPIVLFDPASSDYLNLFKVTKISSELTRFIHEQGFFQGILHTMFQNPLQFWLKLFLGCFLFIFIIFALIGMLRKDFPWSISSIILLSFILYLIAQSGGEIAASRYRHPIMPLLSILSANSLYLLLKKPKEFISLR